MSDITKKDYDDIRGWQKHLRRTAQDEGLSKNTRRKLNYRIGLMDRLVNRIEQLEAENERLRAIYDALLPLKVRGKPVYHLDSKLNAAVFMVAQADEDDLQGYSDE